MGNRATFFSAIGDIPVNLAFTNNFTATTNPTASNDMSPGQNYRRGSVWINTVTNEAFICTNDAVGAANWQTSTTGSGTPGQITAPAASTPTGNGGAALLTGGAGGTTSGNGGTSAVRGGSATAGNGNGGSAVVQGGTANGTGANGSVRLLGVVMEAQGAAAAVNATATLTAAQMIGGVITSTAGAAVAATLPLATALDTAIPDAAAGDSFDFSVINTSATPANTFTVGTAAGWTLVGNMIVAGLAAGNGTSGRFRAAKTAAGAWTLFRLS